jgi:hypothetical protein
MGWQPRIHHSTWWRDGPYIWNRAHLGPIWAHLDITPIFGPHGPMVSMEPVAPPMGPTHGLITPGAPMGSIWGKWWPLPLFLGPHGPMVSLWAPSLHSVA